MNNFSQALAEGGRPEPVMNDFLHWPFFGCLLVLIIYVSFAIKLLRQYEGPGEPRDLNHRPYVGLFAVVDLDGAQLWKSCWGALHPGWLLGFRLFVFCYFLPQLLYNFQWEGFWMFYFYTQWTFLLLTLYFGVAAWVSAKHCLQLTDAKTDTYSRFLEEEVTLTGGDPTSGEALDIKVDTSEALWANDAITSPGLVGYVMQTLFQVAGAAVMLTDFVYWLILVPFVLPTSFKHTFVDINMHAVNAVFLIIEISLNNMYYPWFRAAYVVFWTAAYIVFQWTLHALAFGPWPYPFLDLATPYAPAWYAGLSLFQMGLAMLLMVLVNSKQRLFSKRMIQAE